MGIYSSLLTTSAVFADHELVTISNLIRIIPLIAMTAQDLFCLLYRTEPWPTIILRLVLIFICVVYGLSSDTCSSPYLTGVLSIEDLFFLGKAGAVIISVIFWFVSLHRKFTNFLPSFPLCSRVGTSNVHVCCVLGLVYMVILLRVATLIMLMVLQRCESAMNCGHWIDAQQYG